jgi:spore coat protein U-like protein
MAKIEHLPPKKDRKKFGNLEFYTDKFGNNIMKSKPLDMPRALKINSLRMAKLRKLISPVLSNINTAYAGTVFGKKMCAFNCVVTINQKQCFIGDTDTIDPGLFVLCDNDGSFVGNVVLTSTEADTITATFDSNAQNEDETDDPVKAYGLDVSGNKIWQFEQESARSSGTMTVTHPEMSGMDIAVYLECLDRVNLFMGKPRHVIKYVGSVKVI